MVELPQPRKLDYLAEAPAPAAEETARPIEEQFTMPTTPPVPHAAPESEADPHTALPPFPVRDSDDHSVGPSVLPTPRRGLPLWWWLLGALCATIAVTGLTSSGIGVWLIEKGIAEQAQDKARLDLNSARLVFLGRQNDVRTLLRIASLKRSLIAAAAEGNAATLAAEAGSIKSEGRYDYVDVLDPNGRVLARGQGPLSPAPAAEGSPRPVDPIVKTRLWSQLLAGASDVVSTFVRSPAELASESEELALTARMVLRAADGSESAERPPREISSGLVIEGAAAVRNEAGALLAVLRGGVLLNHDVETVDRIRDTIYEGEAYRGKPTGGATLCLGDVRVATNMVLGDGRRAVGTPIDPVVRHRVLVENRSHVDRADVLGQVAFTAYEPIRDLDGQPIGILSLGIPERKYTRLRNEGIALLLGIVLLGAAVAVAIATLIGRRIVRPVQKLERAITQYQEGNLDVEIPRFGPTPRELHELRAGVMAMSSALRERELQLRYRTEERLGKAERLAMIGRLSAGVAHEINNPLGGILLFSSLLLKKAAVDHPDRSAIERICSEAKRCQQIVQGLLDFSRPREPKLEIVVLENILERSLQLVIGQSIFHNIEVKKDYGTPKPEAKIDPAQLQQVILNLIVNAAEAMEGKGKLRLATRTVENGKSVQIEIADSGCGVSEENLERLFEPFFTTKEVGRGTGLGLSISRGIVEAHDGTIWAESEIGKGTRFYIRLPSPHYVQRTQSSRPPPARPSARPPHPGEKTPDDDNASSPSSPSPIPSPTRNER